MPISVTNSINFVGNNPSCDSVDNPLLDNNGKELVTPQGANYEPENFVKFLDSGLKAY